MHTPRLPYDGMDIRDLMAAQVERFGARRFLIWEPFEGEGAAWTYAEFVQAARRFAGGLRARGMKAGDRLLIHLDNAPEFLIAWLGCAWAGVVAVTSNTHLTADELTYVAGHSQVAGAVTQPAHAALVATSTPRDCWIAVTATDAGAPAAAAPLPARAIAFADVSGAPVALPEGPHDPMAPFAIQYTSGTTARPKAVLWTQANALWGAEMSAAHEGLGPDDTHLVHLPLFHTNAQVYSVLATLWAGGSLVLMPKFSASRFWPVSLKHRCTFTSTVSFCTRALLAHETPAQHFYRAWGSSVCAPPTDARFGVKTIGWFGMTETVTHAIVGSGRLPNTSLSMGRPAPGYEIFVRDEDGAPTTPGAVGDLYIRGVRGLSLFHEYAGDPAATEAAFTDDGLFRTGDRVRVGPTGELFFADRSKDMLKVGGENVAASEVERVILGVPGVREVAVVGRPHAMLGETPVAFIIPTSDGALDATLTSRALDACTSCLAGFKRPTELRLVTALPRSTLEKVAKAELRRLLVAEAESAP